MRQVIGYVTVFVAGFAACASILHFSGGGNSVPVRSTPAPKVTIEEALAPANPSASNTRRGLPSIADAVERVEPAVVNIDISGQRPAGGPFAFLRPGMTVPFNGNGSGIILSQDGYIVTNNHVIETVAERGGEITIRLASGKEYTNVTVVGRDPQTDLAVLKVHGANNLPTAELGDSDKLRVGDWAIAIGNPLGFNSSVTLGIISALNRRNFRNDAEALERVIQTDAAINPGNSGGALADVEGRVVGINTAIASANGGNVGIGFAIPINSARTVIDQLIQQGRVMRPYLGIVYVALENIKAEELPGVTLPEDRRGVIIIAGIEGNAVRAGSPADRAGLQEGDIIRQIDGKQVEGIHSIREEVQKRGVGETITLTIWRNGQTMTVPVTLDEMPEDYTLRNFGNNPFP